MMNEESKDGKVSSMNFMDEKLFKSRSISIFGQINEKLARSVTEQLLALSAESDEPITLYISSPGGHVESGDVIYDMIKYIRPVVRVVGTGWGCQRCHDHLPGGCKGKSLFLAKHPLSGPSTLRRLGR